MPLNILADQDIPYVHEAFRHIGTVHKVAARDITRAAVKGADILLVRSVTSVDHRLVEGSQIQFAGSATIGTDHVDHTALAALGIAFAHARGAGAESVAEYVTAAILVIATRAGLALKATTLGIVGCGDIGSRVFRRAQALGMRVLQNDPPLAEASKGPCSYVPLYALLRESDIVTLHVPLSRTGAHATHHLFGSRALEQMKTGAWLINTARGPVVSGQALHAALVCGSLGGAVLDVWEHEPTPSQSLLHKVSLATPHIAGHSYDGKLLGTILLYRAVARHFGVTPSWDYAALQQPPAPLSLAPSTGTRHAAAWLDALTRTMYDLRADDARMRTLLDVPPEALGACFGLLRTGYPRRRAFRHHQIAAGAVPPALHEAVRHGLGVQLYP